MSLINEVAVAFKKWWISLLLPPRPSPVFVILMEDNSMSHTKRAIIAIPAPREDELSFKDEHDAGLASRHLVVSVNGSVVVDMQLPLNQADFTQGGVPAGSVLDISLSNVLTDGHEGLPVTRTVTAPAEPKPIPVPDSFGVTFEDEPHE